MIDALGVFAPAGTTIAATATSPFYVGPILGTPLDGLWARLDVTAIANCNASFTLQGAPETSAGSGVPGTWLDVAHFSNAGAEDCFAPGEFFCGWIADPQLAFFQIQLHIPGTQPTSSQSSAGAANLVYQAYLCTGRNG